jgi:cysteinyl-tRNA synthetase
MSSPTDGFGAAPAPTAASSGLARSLIKRAVVGIALITLMAAGGAWLMHATLEPLAANTADSDAAERALLLANVGNWGYQHPRFDRSRALTSHADLVVVDPDVVGRNEDGALDALRTKPDGSRRIVLAYLSVAKASRSRPYWRADWLSSAAASGLEETAARTGTAPDADRPIETGSLKRDKDAPVSATAPAWLGPESRSAPGVFRVKYWDKRWQALLFGSARSELDQIIAMGFDGVYVDPADAHRFFAADRATAESDMVDLLIRLAARGRRHQPSFLVVMQNGEDLLAHGSLVRALDAVGKENLLYGVSQPGAANDTADITSSVHYLNKARRANLPVLVVEYLDDAATVNDAKRRLTELGYVPTFAPREPATLGAD